jgi:hypothetical protein
MGGMGVVGTSESQATLGGVRSPNVQVEACATWPYSTQRL